MKQNKAKQSKTKQSKAKQSKMRLENRRVPTPLQCPFPFLLLWLHTSRGKLQGQN